MKKQKVDYELWVVQWMNGKYGWCSLVYTLGWLRREAIQMWQSTGRHPIKNWTVGVRKKQLRCVRCKIVAKDQI